MVIDRKRFEVDRLLNVIRAFGWEATSQQYVGEKIVLQIEKTVSGEMIPPGRPTTPGAEASAQ